MLIRTREKRIGLSEGLIAQRSGLFGTHAAEHRARDLSVGRGIAGELACLGGEGRALS